jgi:chlorophyll synthase
MQRAGLTEHRGSLPEASALLQLLKPITWFPPMWAFLCGTVSSGLSPLQQPLLLILGLALTGPLVCGASQVVNDWFDREVDAINEPDRPIPSGRVPGQFGLYFAILWSLLSLTWAALLGVWVLVATALALMLAWAYSAPPFRLKLNGWWGNAAVGFSYEGLAWVTGAAVMLGGQLPPAPVVMLAVLYSVGAHGIMTLNDFKSIDGDRALGIRSIPARYGARRAAQLACAVMIGAQILVAVLLLSWSETLAAATVLGLLLLQMLAMVRLLQDPRGMAPWYNATGVSLYVLGMLCSAYAIGSSPL